MLSPSSLSSTSLEQNSSTTASASFFAPSECSNSGCLSISSPDPDNFSNNNGISTTNQTSSPENRMYEYETTTKASSSSVPFPSVSNISPSPPLLLHNPCFQSLTFQRRQSNHHSTPATSYFGGNGSYGFKTLNSLQNLQLTTDNNTDASSASLLRVVSAKRTISLQQVLRPIPIVDDKRWSFASSSDFPTNRPQNGHNGCKSHSQFVAATHIGHQSAAVMDWLVDMSLSHIMKLFPQAQANDGSTRLYRHVQQAAVTLRGKFHQILGRGAHNDGGHHFPNAVSSDCRHQLFGVPLAAVQANTADGNPLPQFVHDLMDYIAKYAGDTELAEGIFRKSGAKGRIQEIMECCSTLSPSQPLPRHLLDDRQTQLTDLCDVLKKYFYQLPERLFTDRISQLLEELLVNELPAERHFQALHYCILLLPAENREALTTLLEFLSRIARHSKVTRMESQSLARCWCPALFHSSISAESSKDKENGTISRRLTRRKTVGMLNEKALRAIEPFSRLLARMIDDWDRLLRLPRGLESKVAAKGMSICYDLAVPLKKGQFEFTEEMHSNFRRQLFRLKENYFGGWTSWELRRVFPDGSQLFVRPINDMIPLKCFRVQMSVAAPPNLILAAILNRRNVWDPNIASCKRMGPSGQHFDIVRLQYKSPCGRAGQEKCTFLARRWTYAELDVDKICSLIECSIVPREDDGSGKCCWGHVSVYESKFLIVPLCPGHSQLSYISRTDFKGKPSGWYDRVYGEMLAHQMRRLKKCLLKCKSKYGGATVV